MRVFLSALLAFGLACGDDSMAPSDGGPDARPPDTPPFGIEVRVSPPRESYRTDQTIRMVAEVTDVDGALIEGAAVTWSVEPASAATALGDGVFTLIEEGFVELTGCTSAAGPDGEPLCDFSRILVDSGAPNLEVSSPTPGEELGGEGATEIVVTGSVADTRDVQVFVNGELASLDEMGSFTHRLTPLFGANHLEVVASDGLTESSRVEMDVLWADGYVPATNGDRPEIALPEGLVLQLGQPFFDDGSPLDTTADPVRTEDLADVFELVLRHVDFRGLLPDPLVDSAPTLLLRVTEVRTGDVNVQLDVVDGGVELFVRIGSLAVDTAGSLEFEGAMLDLGGGLDASLSAFARVDVSKAGPDAPIESRVRDLQVAVEDIEGRFTAPEANAILQLAEGLLRSTLETQLQAAFSGSLLDAIPAVLTDALGSLDTALQGQSVAIDTPLFPAVTLQLDGRLAGLDSRYRRYLRAPLQLTVGTDQRATHPDSRGAANLVAAADPLFATSPVQLGVKVALLNGLLHTLWNSGLLEIDASALLPEDLAGAIMSARLSGRMPPVIRPARGAETDDLVLVVGQAELTLEALGATTLFGITLEAGASIDMVDGALSLTLAEEPFVRVWIIESSAARPPIDDATLAALLTTELWPQLRAAIAGGLDLQLPTLSVGDLTSIAPDLDGFALNLELRQPLDVREDSLVLDALLVGSVP